MRERKTGRTVRRSGRGAAISLAAVLGLTLAACGSDASEESRSSPESRVAVEGFAFVPARLTVATGTEVTWTNRDKILHTVTTGTPGKQGIPGVSKDTAARPDGLLDRELDGEGTSVSFTFRRPGTYEYYCAVHAGMSGTVEVR